MSRFGRHLPAFVFLMVQRYLFFFLANKNSIFLTKQVIVARNDFSQLPRHIGCCLFAGVTCYAKKSGGQDAGKRMQAAGERAGKRRKGKVCVVMTGLKGKAIHALYAARLHLGTSRFMAYGKANSPYLPTKLAVFADQTRRICIEFECRRQCRWRLPVAQCAAGRQLP